MVPGRDFVMAPFIGQNISEDRKKSLCCKTSWFSIRKYVMTKKKKKGLCYQSVGFRSQKKKQKTKWCHPKMVTPGASRPPPPSEATASCELKLFQH